MARWEMTTSKLAKMAKVAKNTGAADVSNFAGYWPSRGSAKNFGSMAR